MDAIRFALNSSTRSCCFALSVDRKVSHTPSFHCLRSHVAGSKRVVRFVLPVNRDSSHHQPLTCPHETTSGQPSFAAQTCRVLSCGHPCCSKASCLFSPLLFSGIRRKCKNLSCSKHKHLTRWCGWHSSPAQGREQDSHGALKEPVLLRVSRVAKKK